MPFDSELRRSRRLSDIEPVTPSAAVDRSHARSASDPGTAGALGPSGILRASPADEPLAVAPESETWEDIPLTPRGHVRAQSADGQRHGLAGSHLPARSASAMGRLRHGVEDDRASTIYGSTREFPTLQELLELERDSDTESDGYTTAPEDNDEWEAEADDSSRAHRGSRRRSDLEIAPAQQSHVLQIEQGAQTSAAAAAAAPQGLWARRAEGYKVGYLLMDSVAALVASVGWVLNRKIPLFRPVGQALADTLHFTFATLDAAHSGNKVKTGGKAGSAVGRGLAASSALVAAKSSTSASQKMNPVSWAAHTVGRGLVAYDAYRGGKTAAASGQFAASAMALIGVVGTTLERFHATTPAFLALETICNFYTTAPPIGGAIQGARDSKVRMPWLRDSNVVAKELIALGTGMGAIASTLNQVYSLKDKEQGTHDSAHFASLIGGLGAAGWFMSTIGYSMVMMIDLRPAPQPDIEANPGPSTDAPPPPDPGAGSSGVAV